MASTSSKHESEQFTYKTDTKGSISSSNSDPNIPDLDPESHQQLILNLIHPHNVPCPLTPPLPSATLAPMPLRYPETLGTVITILPSSLKGLGVFATRDLEPGTILLCEAPLITLIDTGTRADPLDAAVSALTPMLRESFHSLHAFRCSNNESLNRSIVYSNGYSILDDLATGVFETASRINHSCVPNSHYVWKNTPGAEFKGRMVFYNRFKLLEGEEVTVDYGHKPLMLKKIYGFDCSCGGCTEAGSDRSIRGESDYEGNGGEKWSVEAMVGGMSGVDEVIRKEVESETSI